MNILLVHNFYLQSGGEDVAFRNEGELLRQNGHTVRTFEEHNRHISGRNRVSVALNTIWSEESRHRLLSILKQEKIEIVHFQNTFPLISPSAYYACNQMGAAVVQTLQNYRLMCPVAILYRDGRVCEDCIGKFFPLPAIQHACYHDSATQSAVVSAMLSTHRLMGTWNNKVDAYIALTEFSRNKFIEGGLPANRIFLKPNVNAGDPGRKEVPGDFVLFVGRLSHEKGIQTLLSAWKSASIPLKIIGDGPLREEVIAQSNDPDRSSIEYLGQLPHVRVLECMKRARLLVFPSEWYEGFPLVIVEALACGLPVVTSGIGSQAEIIRDGYSGLHFRVGDANDLQKKIELFFQNPLDIQRMSDNAREQYQEKYTTEANYRQLIEIYSKALENRA